MVTSVRAGGCRGLVVPHWEMGGAGGLNPAATGRPEWHTSFGSRVVLTMVRDVHPAADNHTSCEAHSAFVADLR